MSVQDEEEYKQISEDWRHRDNLTWQIPTIVVAIGGALIAGAFGLKIDSQHLCTIRLILIGFGALLSLCLTFALTQNLWYQVGSGEALMKIVIGEGHNLPKNKMRRTLSPKIFGIYIGQFIIRLFTRYTGSAFLLIVCIWVTFILFRLLIWIIDA